MILKHEGIVMAEQVIDKLNGKLKEAGLEEHIMVAEAFDNLREQGLCFGIPGGEHIAICNGRIVTSDLFVYVYRETQFPSNLPAKGQWNIIDCDNNAESAANAILARIKEVAL